MTTKYINGSGLSKLLQLISNSVSLALSSISNKLSNIDNTHANCIDVNYDELCNLRDTNNLIPGQYYRITDYVTTTSQENTMSNGDIRPIMVLAINNYNLSEEAMTDDGCKVWYCLDNDTSRFAWAGATKKTIHFHFLYAGQYGTFRIDDSLVKEEGDTTYYGYKYIGGGGSPQIFDKNTILWYPEKFPELSTERTSHIFYEFIDGVKKEREISSNFFEGDVEQGKGVIYRMIDKNGNDCPYDFKSIMFKNPNDETDDKYYYTFYYEDSNEMYDATTSGITKNRCYNNVIKYYKEGSIMMYIPNNIFNITHYIPTHRCCNNTFGFNCYNNIFGSNCHDNIFGDECYNNTFDSNFYNNSFGNNCYNNTFDSNFYNNSFGNNCYNNIFGSNCHDNTFGSKCYDNIFGSECCDNIFGSECCDNSFIYVNSSDSTKTETLNGIVNCNFSNEYQYNELKHLKTSNISNIFYLRNVHFCKGINGNLNKINTITIEGTLPDNIETKVAKNSKGELKIYCEADLIA